MKLLKLGEIIKIIWERVTLTIVVVILDQMGKGVQNPPRRVNWKVDIIYNMLGNMREMISIKVNIFVRSISIGRCINCHGYDLKYNDNLFSKIYKDKNMTKDCGCGNKAKQTMQSSQYRPPVYNNHYGNQSNGNSSGGFSGYQVQPYMTQAQQWQQNSQWPQQNFGHQYNQQYNQQYSGGFSGPGYSGGFSGSSGNSGQRVNPNFQRSGTQSGGQPVNNVYTPKPCTSCGRH